MLWSQVPLFMICVAGQVQLRASAFGTSPAFGQSSQLPLFVICVAGQALQLRASAFGTSPAFGQSSQLPLFVICVAGHSSAKIKICLISCTIQGKTLVVYLYSKNSTSDHIIISIYGFI